MPLTPTQRIVSWPCQVIAALILAQTLYFKFTAAPESVHVFRTLGVEPWGRVAAGMAELIAVVLLLHGRWAALGAVLTLGVICGAIGSHLTRLGIVVMDDGGLLFGLAVVVFVAAALVLFIRRTELPVMGRWALAAIPGR